MVSQRWQYARLGVIGRIPLSVRTFRSRENPQRRSGPSQAGQRNRPAARSASTTSGSTIIANTLTPAVLRATFTRLAPQLAAEQGELVLKNYHASSRPVRTTPRW